MQRGFIEVLAAYFTNSIQEHFWSIALLQINESIPNLKARFGYLCDENTYSTSSGTQIVNHDDHCRCMMYDVYVYSIVYLFLIAISVHVR